MVILSDLEGLSSLNHIYQKELEEIQTCKGCFHCWIKTPGKCILKDNCWKIISEIAVTSTLIIITKITYGGYSYSIKKILDRVIPNSLPFFTVVNNEMHHTRRYSTKLKLIVIGYGVDLSCNERDTFTNLVKANSINLKAFENYEYFIAEDKKEVQRILNDIGGTINEANGN